MDLNVADVVILAATGVALFVGVAVVVIVVMAERRESRRRVVTGAEPGLYDEDGEDTPSPRQS